MSQLTDNNTLNRNVFAEEGGKEKIEEAARKQGKVAKEAGGVVGGGGGWGG